MFPIEQNPQSHNYGSLWFAFSSNLEMVRAVGEQNGVESAKWSKSVKFNTDVANHILISFFSKGAKANGHQY